MAKEALAALENNGQPLFGKDYLLSWQQDDAVIHAVAELI